MTCGVCEKGATATNDYMCSRCRDKANLRADQVWAETERWREIQEVDGPLLTDFMAFCKKQGLTKHFAPVPVMEHMPSYSTITDSSATTISRYPQHGLTYASEAVARSYGKDMRYIPVEWSFEELIKKFFKVNMAQIKLEEEVKAELDAGV